MRVYSCTFAYNRALHQIQDNEKCNAFFEKQNPEENLFKTFQRNIFNLIDIMSQNQCSLVHKMPWVRCVYLLGSFECLRQMKFHSDSISHGIYTQGFVMLCVVAVIIWFPSECMWSFHPYSSLAAVARLPQWLSNHQVLKPRDWVLQWSYRLKGAIFSGSGPGLIEYHQRYTVCTGFGAIRAW